MWEREFEKERGAEVEEGKGKRGCSIWRKAAWKVLSEEMRSVGGVVKVELRLKREVFRRRAGMCYSILIAGVGEK